MRQAAAKGDGGQVSEVTLSHARSRWWALQVSERRILLMLGDLLAISAALGIAVWVRIPGFSESYSSWRPFFLDQLRWWLVLWPLWIAASLVSGCYDLQVAASVTTSAVYSAACALVVALAYLLVPWVTAPLTWSRLAWFIFAGLAMVGVSIWRTIYATLLARTPFTRRALIVGSSEAGHALARVVNKAGKASGIELVGFLDDPALAIQRVEPHPMLPVRESVLSAVKRLDVDEIVVAMGAACEIGQELFRELVLCWEYGITIISMPMFYEEVAGAIPLEHVGRDMFVLVDHHRGLELRIWDLIRRVLDIGLGTAGLLAMGAFLPLLALAIELDSPGRVFYTQERVGRGGRRFRVVKFRSMVQNAELAGAVWAQTDDPRVTHVGRFLRRTRIDEIPQLWNVLKGDMTLIGPRPERPEFVEQLDELLPYYAIRHSIKPGITGWAQVRYHYGNCVDDARMKLQYDLYYVKRRGPVLDALIALTTLRVMLTLRGT